MPLLVAYLTNGAYFLKNVHICMQKTRLDVACFLVETKSRSRSEMHTFSKGLKKFKVVGFAYKRQVLELREHTPFFSYSWESIYCDTNIIFNISLTSVVGETNKTK